MTHKERLLGWLSDGRWVCGEEFLEGHFFTYSQRASEVNKMFPDRIVNRPCQIKGHSCDQYADRWVREPRQMGLLDVDMGVDDIHSPTAVRVTQ